MKLGRERDMTCRPVGLNQGAPQVLTCITGVAHSTVTLLNTLVDMFPTCLLKSSVLTCLMKLFYI